ncbi:protein NEDD1 [Erpetoichthys calabaricus]|uniref:NEDD1 gamma-tubulin ring complex targeting factor n=1 Tax=Erpetoichthys calabaricus TaxID=27687 RepID=A0A8C4RRB2_ERPCA|nr:protein NEDD1 [Erpetoichthys calabaricus]XP_028664860.1 protein NEDD1 [Erpetoichthys calabaricus]
MEDSIRLVSAGDDIKIWNSSSMTVVDQFSPHTPSQTVSRVCWSSNNHFLVSASGTGDKIVVSSCKSSPVPILELAEGKKQTCINLNSTSQFIVSGGLDSCVNVWDLKLKKLYRSLKDHKDVVTCVSFNSNDSYIASGSASGEIILHSITTNLSSTPFGFGSSQPIQDLKYSYIKKSLMGSVSDSGTVVLWDANTQKSLHSFENAHKAPACGLCFSPANELLFVTVGLDKKIICYDSSSKILLRSLVAESPLTAIDFMPDGAALAVGSSRGKVYLYDLRMLTSPVKAVTAHKTSVQCVKFQNALSHIKSSSKASVSKSSSSLSAATSRRAAVKTGNPVANNLMSSVGRDVQQKSTATLEQNSGPVAVEKVDGRPDGRGIPNSTSLDVFPSKETDSIKGTDGLPSLDKFDSVGRNSLSDVFSPIRDDYSFQKSSADLAKGDVMDFMSHFSGNLTSHKIPTSGLQTSNTLLSFGESPLKAEDADSDSLKVGQATVGSHDTQSLIKVNRALSESANSSGCGNTSTPVMSSIKTLEPNERLGKDLQTKLLYDSPVSGAPCGGSVLSPEPILSAALTEGVASSLSEKIAGTINNNGSGPPLSSIQIHFIRKMIQETLEDFREACHKDIVNLQVEMIRQFYIQLNEIHCLIEKYSVNDTLVAEIEKLKEENKRLRANF